MTLQLRPILALPDDPAAKVQTAAGLGPGESLRIAYVPGPGQLYRTYEHWKRGEFDPTVPSVAYSTMFFELCSALDAEGLLVRQGKEQADVLRDGAFTFETAAWRYETRGPIGYHRSRFAYARACLRALKNFQPDAAIVATDFDWQYLPLVKRACPRLILSVHNTIWPMATPSLSTRQKIGNRLIGQWLKSIDAAVCTSHECERQIRRLTQDRVPTFVAVPQQIAPPDAAPAKAGPAKRLLYLGRVEEPKGVFDLLRAFADLRNSRRDLSLVYAGGGGDLNRLKAAVHESGLQDSVAVLGHLPADRTHKELQKAELLVCPTRTSFNEGLAFVCFEAAAHGVPTVMSSVVPAQDLLGDGCAVFSADNTEALRATLVRYIDDIDAWRSLAAAAKARSGILFDRSQSWGSQVFRALTA